MNGDNSVPTDDVSVRNYSRNPGAQFICWICCHVGVMTRNEFGVAAQPGL